MLLLGGVVVTAAALLAGTSGFGLGLVATPILLLCGFSISFAVTAALLIGIVTRLNVAWRLRHEVTARRVALLVGGAAPGLWIGSWTLGVLDAHDVKLVVGGAVAGSALALAWIDRAPPQTSVGGLEALAGFLGGLLGTTTSLIGVPPALLLARRRLATRPFLADLAVYLVATAAIGLVVLAVDDNFSVRAVWAAALWLPAVLVANVVGTRLALRSSEQAFRRLTLVLGFAAGLVTIATA
jgi:uncharacterized membrane protein YfcA